MVDQGPRAGHWYPPDTQERYVKRTPALATVALATALAAATWGSGDALGAANATHRPGAIDRGGPGKWTKVSTGKVGITFVPSLARTSDGDLHLIYSREVGSGHGTLGHTAIHTDGRVVRQNTVLSANWAFVDPAPVLVSGAGDLRVVFGGNENNSNDAMFTSTSDNSGAHWSASPSEVPGLGGAAGSAGTAAATLSDGTPIEAFPLNDTLVWHKGASGSTVHSIGGRSVSDASMVRDGSTVWLAWHADGSTKKTNGTFVKQILPTVGKTLKAPGSSKGASSPDTGRVALAARDGGGVYAAYCVGYPTCNAVKVWKVGSKKTSAVPHSRFATAISLSPSPSGRLWVAWADNIPKVRAVRTGKNGLTMGAVQTAGLPKGANAAYALAIDGTRGRGDIVVNVGNAFWHTQVLAGLTLHAAPSTWNHGRRQKVTFAVTDAHEAVGRAKVKVGSDHCSTNGHGTCSLTFPASFGQGKHTARATRSGYVAATTGLRVR